MCAFKNSGDCKHNPTYHLSECHLHMCLMAPWEGIIPCTMLSGKSSTNMKNLHSKGICVSVCSTGSGSGGGADFSVSKDRLLTSEIAELQAKMQSLLKENRDLRLELSKISGADLSRIHSSRKVRT